MANIELSEREQRFLHRAKNKNGESFLYIKEEVEEFKEMIAERAEKAENECKRFFNEFYFWCCQLESPILKRCKILNYQPCTYEACPIVAKAKEGL